jgi:hypothetical protein
MPLDQPQYLWMNGNLVPMVDGYDRPILLTQQGRVAEGSGAWFFMVRKGEVITPPTTAVPEGLGHGGTSAMTARWRCQA